jgi:hypothetical protein
MLAQSTKSDKFGTKKLASVLPSQYRLPILMGQEGLDVLY